MNSQQTCVTSGVSDAIVAAGSQEILANALGVTQQAVSGWLSQGWVPKGRAIEIEANYGVPRARLVDPKILDLVDTGSDL
jgi:hypothetical protein